MSDSEFLPLWKKYPGVAGTMIKVEINLTPRSHVTIVSLAACQSFFGKA
ncbi:MAG: hypothetical protein V2B19_08240 [Pseudomonadota bacterium]